MKTIILFFSLSLMSFSAFAKSKQKAITPKPTDWTVSEVQDLIDKDCKKGFEKTVVSSDTFFTYKCETVMFYVFKRVLLASDARQEYRVSVIDYKTREPIAKIEASQQTAAALLVITGKVIKTDPKPLPAKKTPIKRSMLKKAKAKKK